MAENQNYIGVAMGLDVTDLKPGLSEANKQIQLANSKFKAASSGMDDWTKSTEGLSAKIEQLGTVLDMQKRKLAGLEAEYSKVAKEQGENSEAARRLQVQINNQQAVVNRTEKEYKNYKETLKGVEAGQIDLEKVSLRAGKAVEKAGKQVEKAGAQAESAGDGFTIAKGAVAGFIANGLTAMVSAAGNAIKSVLGLAEATREYRKTLATLDTAAEDVGVSTDYIRDKYTDMMGVLQDDAGVTEGLNNLLTAGFDEKTLDGITASLEGAALKWKDTLKFEGLADSLQEWIGSGGESLTGNFAELLERMGYNLDDVKEKTAGMTAEQRRNYATNLLASEGLSEVSENYRTQNADMIAAQKAQVEYQNTTAELGATVEPITTKIQQGFTKILEKIIELVSGSDLEGFGETIDNAFDGFINDVLPAIVDGLKWIIENKDILISGIAGIGAAMLTMNVANMIMGVVKAFKAFKAAQEGATIAQWLLNLAMNANPIGIIISLIAGLVTAFVLLWNKSEAFRNFWIGLWDGIKNAAKAVADWFKNAWGAVVDWFKNAWAKIDLSGTWNKLKKGASDAWNGIKSVFSKVGSFFSDTFSKAWTKVKNIFSTGGKIFDGIKDGIVSAFKNIVNAIIRGINKVVAVPFNAINKVLGKLRNISIAGAEPFKNLISEINVPKIPELFRGGILKKGQVGLLEGKGTEAVVPLEKNLGWIKKIAAQLVKHLSGDVSSIKGNAAALAYGETGGKAGRGRGNTTINAPLNLNYNGKLSRKELKKTENNHYKAIKMKLQAEGAI